MKKLIVIITLILISDVFGAGAIFNGPNIKLLKNNLKFKENEVKIMTGDADKPNAVSKDAGLGSLYIEQDTGIPFWKSDSGDSSNWTVLPYGDTSGNLLLAPLGNINLVADEVAQTGSGAMQIASGTTAARPSSPVAGQMRYNSENGTFEGYTTEWGAIGRGAAKVLNNMLKDPSFEESLIEGTVTTSGSDTSAVATRTSEATALNKNKLVLSASGNATLDYTYTKSANFEGQQLYAYCEIKTANTNVTFNSMLNGSVDSTLDVVSDDKWRYYRIPLVGGATSQGFKIDHTNGSETPDIDVDNCFVGKEPDALGVFADPVELTVETANEFSAKVDASEIITSENHDWLDSCTRDGNNDLDCTIKSGVFNVAPACAVTASISSLNNGVYAYILESSTTNIRARTLFNSLPNGSVPSEIICSKQGADVFKNEASDRSTIFTQQTELTANTANTLSFSMNDTGIVSNENYDFVNGNCIRTNQSLYYRYDCPLNDIGLTEKMTCVVSSIQGAGLYLVAQEKNGSSTTNLQFTSQFSNGNSILAGAMDVVCSKSNADVNKSATIVGKFENINSTELAYVEAKGRASTQALTANVTDIIWNQSEDDAQNLWNGTQFTAPRDGVYHYEVAVSSTSGTAAGGAIRIAINGTIGEYIYLSPTATTTRYKNFSGKVKLSAGQTLSFRSDLATTLEAESGALNHLRITEQADSESIVKNLLAESSQTKCQTKFLAGDITSTGSYVNDLKFTNLKAGRFYKLFFQAELTTDTATSINIQIFNADNDTANQIGKIAQVTNAGTNITTTRSNSWLFKNVSTAVSLYYIESGLNQFLRGNGTRNETFATLCEMPETFVETTEW